MQKKKSPCRSRALQKRAAPSRHGTAGISTVFFCPFLGKKSIEITRSHLLQFAARAIHCDHVEESSPSTGSRIGTLRDHKKTPRRNEPARGRAFTGPHGLVRRLLGPSLLN